VTPAGTEEEASLLLGYVMSVSGAGWTAEASDRARYGQALRAQLPTAHRLDPVVYRHRWLLGGLDAISRFLYPRSILQQKLLVAVALVECHPASAPWLLPRDRGLAGYGWQAARLCLRIVAKVCVGLSLLPFQRFLRRNVQPL
jgi:hypothetical protein